jgi:peptidylprolyl isomerase
MSKQRPPAPTEGGALNPAPIIAAAVVLAVLGVLIFAMLSNRSGTETAAAPTSDPAAAATDEAAIAPTSDPAAAPTVDTAAPTAASATEEAAAAGGGSAQTYSAAPDLTIDPSQSYTATITLAKGGEIVVRLRPDLAPQTVNSFVFLAREGFYDGVTFHRVIPGFVAQGGDPTGTGTGGPGYTLPDEYSEVPFDKPGLLAMASTGPGTNSAGSQFFITLAPTPDLNNQYTIFGEVVEGQEVVDGITPRDPSIDPNAPPGDAIQTITITEG